MRLRAVTRITNDKLRAAKAASGLTLDEINKECRVKPNDWCAILRLDFASVPLLAEKVDRLADLFGLDIDDICPPSLQGRSLPTIREAISEVTADRLLAMVERQILPSVAETIAKTEEREAAPAAVKRVLALVSRDQAAALRARFGIGGSSYRRYARRSGRKIGAVKMQASKALNQLCDRSGSGNLQIDSNSR